MYLSGDALTIGRAILGAVGGGDPSLQIEDILRLDPVKHLSMPEFLLALNELDSFGVVRITKAIGAPRPGVPKELQNIVSVSIARSRLLDEITE
jgi:DUF917 family protein